MDVGYLIYRDGHFAGFLKACSGSPIASLTNNRFDNAKVIPALAFPFFGTIYLFIALSDEDEGIALSAERTTDRGLKVVMTDVNEISDLQETPMIVKVVVTDIYGCDHNINDVIEAAKAAAADGSILRSINLAEVTGGELTYNRRKQSPSFTVFYGGEDLAESRDICNGFRIAVSGYDTGAKRSRPPAGPGSSVPL